MISCCYCGVQSVFVADAALHALVCSTCGAPISAQKARPLADHTGAKLPKAAKARKPKTAKPPKPGPKPGPARTGDWAQVAALLVQHARGRKKKTSGWKRVFDVIEDIFD